MTAEIWAWFAMDGFGIYIWPVYACGLLLVIVLALTSWLRFARLSRKYREAREKRPRPEAQAKAPSSSPTDSPGKIASPEDTSSRQNIS